MIAASLVRHCLEGSWAHVYVPCRLSPATATVGVRLDLHAWLLLLLSPLPMLPFRPYLFLLLSFLGTTNDDHGHFCISFPLKHQRCFPCHQLPVSHYLYVNSALKETAVQYNVILKNIRAYVNILEL